MITEVAKVPLLPERWYVWCTYFFAQAAAGGQQWPPVTKPLGRRYMRGLRHAIDAEAQKLVRRHEDYARWVDDETRRRQRRVTVAVPRLKVWRPSYWEWSTGFNPYLVRANANAVSYSMKTAISRGEYAPRSPAGYAVPKSDGTERIVSVFQVADNALSNLVYRNLMGKNRGKFSSRSYAYRSDLTAHDAVQYIQSEFAQYSRLFVAEYDFSQYFESISHEHIWRTLDEGKYLMTRSERSVIKSFLFAPLPEIDPANYSELDGHRRSRGVPQGTSISLFLANVAASQLDTQLERIGVGFVRYADDTLIWSPDYSVLLRAVDLLHRVADEIGADINLRKSEGVSLLASVGVSGEIRSKTQVDFVGYKIGLSNLSIKDAAVNRIKQRVRQLLYRNLLQPLTLGDFDPTRISSAVDRDYVVFIWQLRRFLYGDLSERELRRFQSRGAPLRRFKGAMSYYPLVDDTALLANLDRWMSTEVWLTMKRRADLLTLRGFGKLPPPLNLDRQSLISFTLNSTLKAGALDLRLPSIRRISGVIRRAARTYGPNQVGSVATYY